MFWRIIIIDKRCLLDIKFILLRLNIEQKSLRDLAVQNMVYQILNGDSLAYTFKDTTIAGEIVIMREALVEGGLDGETLEAFWELRSGYVAATYGDNLQGYYDKVVGEIEKLLAAAEGSEFNLWFGYDLFCQANMWFLLSLINDLPIEKQVYMVYPVYNTADIWSEFGPATAADLLYCYGEKMLFSPADLQLGKQLWTAYKHNDLDGLAALAETQSQCFPYLREVCRAHIDRFADGGRPKAVVKHIMQNGTSDFWAIFKQFTQQAGVYGFGDLQVRRLVDEVGAGL